MIEVQATPIEDLKIIKPKVFGDSRGYFLETHNKKDFEEHGLHYDFVQDNQSYSKFGTIRGLHFQRADSAQAKLMRVIKGKILDVALDIRKDSPTFGKHFSVELSEENFLQILIPRGFAHGFSVLSEDAIISYKCDNFYSPENEGGILYSDPNLNIDWQIPKGQEVVSDKDLKNPSFDKVEL